MTALRVLRCGPGLTVQDFGRFGWRRFGVATAGAMDRLSLAIANALCDGPPDAAALELAAGPARLGVEDGPLLLAVAGPGARLTVDGALVPEGCGVIAPPGAEVTAAPGPASVFAYLAVAGGLATPAQMGSRSMHRRSGVGGPPLAPGDRLPVGPTPYARPRRLARPPAEAAGPIRIVLGPQAERFAPAAFERLFGATWRVDPRSDRMGMRLEGPELPLAAGWNLVSDATVPGSVQAPGDGKPIVLMRDCQTTGGYPKIATVATADLDRLAQTPPGAALRFTAVAFDDAVALARARDGLLRGLRGLTEPTARAPDAERLMAVNLVSGVTDGTTD